MLPVDCPACGKCLKVKDDLAGKKVRCPQCGVAVLVPAATPEVRVRVNVSSGSADKQIPGAAPRVEASEEETLLPASEGGASYDSLLDSKPPDRAARRQGKVDERARRDFEAAWNAGRPQAIERFLPPSSSPSYVPTLVELVIIEMELLLKAAAGTQTVPDGHVSASPRVEEYLRRFPALNEPACIGELLGQEFRARHRFGDRPRREEFEQRFPGLLPVAGELSLTLRDDAGKYFFLAPAQGPDEIGRLGPYRIVQVLGAGGMGVVFRAEDTHLERPVALKAMLPELAGNAMARQRFLREAKAAAGIKHHHIVAIYQVGEERGAPYLAMELLEGQSLDERLKRDGKLPLADIARIGREIAEGLAAAHERGLMHRDIKPANIWLEGKDGWVKILDFGLARGLDDQTHLTQTGVILGTPAYMSPEQATGKEATQRSDLFSLGCVLYRMCTGQIPFHGPDTIAILTALAVAEPTAPAAVNPAIPAELSELVMQLLAKKPEARPASARIVIDALRSIEADHSTTLPAQPSGTPRAKKRTATMHSLTGAAGRRSRVALIAGGIVCLLAVAFGAYRVFFSDRTLSAPLASRGPADKEKPFVLVRAGSEAREFGNFDAILDQLQNGDAIEVHGNGPFKIGVVRTSAALTIRAGTGYRPRFEASGTALGQQAWFTVDGASLIVEGCDFLSRGPIGCYFSGGGAPWRIANCRLLKYNGPVLEYSGPRLRLEDNIFAQDYTSAVNLLVLGPDTQAELDNNIIDAGPRANFISFKKGGQKVALRNNTIVAGQGLTSPKLEVPVTVDAQGNILDMSNWLIHSLPEPRMFQWRGKHNLYVGAALTVRGAENKPIVKDLAGWSALWPDVEIGSREAASFLPTYQEGRSLHPETAVAFLERFVQAARGERGDAGTGPDWKLIGPGDGYVQALAAENKLILKDFVKREPAAGGPFDLLSRGKIQGSFLALRRAVDAATDGDTIIIHGNGPYSLTGSPPKARNLTIKAAPGYRPILLNSIGPNLRAVEGIDFRGAGIGSSLGRLKRVANCSFDGKYGISAVFDGARGKDTAEIVNCVLLPTGSNVQINNRDGFDHLRIRNSVLPAVLRDRECTKGCRIELDRCLVWRPQPGTAIRMDGTGNVSIIANECIFECHDSLLWHVNMVKLTGWTGSRNLYRLGIRPWLVNNSGSIGLDTWRRLWKSDADSWEAEPLVYEPRQWQLLPTSPGYRQSSGGLDYGADVSRVARPTP